MEFLKQLCEIHAPSGSEYKMTEFLLDYIDVKKESWKVQPTIISGDGFQDNIMLVFGNPTSFVPFFAPGPPIFIKLFL